MKLQYTYALLLLFGLPLAPALGSPAGELDPAFGDHGRVLLRASRFDELFGVDVFVDPASGKLLVVADGYHHDVLLRFNNDGSLDQDFGEQGLVEFDFGGEDLNIHDVQWLANGDLLIAGAAHVYGDPSGRLHGVATLARMHADGTPDLNFGDGGRAPFAFGGAYEFVADIVLQADGRIVVLGGSDFLGSTDGSGVRWILARYTQDGLPDGSFGTSLQPGVSVIDAAGIEVQPRSMLQQRDGRFVICGDAASGTGTPGARELLAIRIDPDGAPDVSFGSYGMLLLGGWQDAVEVNTCLELADGHLIFAGSTGSGDWQRAASWRLTPAGQLDADFGNRGLAVLDTATPSAANTIAFTLDGALAIAGTQWQPDNQWRADNNAWVSWTDMLVARVNASSGDADQAFGDRGMTRIDFGARGFTGNPAPARLAQQPDGKLLIMGSQIDWYDWYPVSSIVMTRLDPYGAGSNGWAGLIDTIVTALPAIDTVALHIRRTGGSTGSLTVDYRTVDGTAIAGEDYVASSGTAAWSDGDTSDRIVTIDVSHAAVPGNESFTFELANSSGGLAVDQTRIVLYDAWPVAGNPPSVPRSDNANGAGNSGGGGAIGSELLLLLLLVLRRAQSSTSSTLICPVIRRQT